MTTTKIIQFQSQPELLKIPRRYAGATILDIHNTNYKNLALNYINKFDHFFISGVGLGLFGPPGTGKTYTAAAIALELAVKRKAPHSKVPVFWVNSSLHFERLIDLKEFHNAAYFSLTDKLLSTPLVVFDDISSIQHLTKVQDKFFSVIQARYSAKLPSIFTGEFTLGQDLKSWGQMDACFNSALTRRIYETIGGNFAANVVGA